ncbi:MAG: hypothetical protein JWP08_1495, partial [Bryobacterales bacterium]|nr:hypothetical protein [Bryobacterales bacterium]
WALCLYLIFFLEDLFELVWNGRAQFELLRILFSDPAAAAATSKAQDLYLAADSQYRNDRTAFRRIDRQYTALPGAEMAREAEGSITILANEIDDLEQQEADALTQLAEVIDGRKSVTLSAELQRSRVEELRRTYETQQGVAIVRSFPKLHDTARLTFVDLATGVGCLVCGSQSNQIGRTYDKRIQRGMCPVCESKPSEQEFNVSKARNGVPALETTRAELTSAEESLHAQLERQQELQGQYDSLVAQRAQVAAEIESRRLELRVHRSVIQRNESSSEITKQYRVLVDELAASKADLQRLFEAYDKHVRSQEKRIRSLSASLRRRFEIIARDLMAERCTLGYSADERRIGQEANWAAFPRFSILMTSGVFVDPHERKQRSDVSESQAEFIDLAFRMALIDEATADRTDGMIVIETPEASLDAVFAKRFGKLLRLFAYRAGHRNVVVSTTNLVNGPMLPELLKAPRARTSASIERRLINLLDIAAKTAALKENETRYRAEYRAAMRAALE